MGYRGIAATVLGLTWLIGSLAILFVILVRAHRVLDVIQQAPVRLASAIDPSIAAEPPTGIDGPGAPTLPERLAAADAKLSVPTAPSDAEAVDRTE